MMGTKIAIPEISLKTQGLFFRKVGYSRYDESSKILWRVDPLLYNDSEVGGYTRAVSGQRLGKHVSVARQQLLTMQQFNYNNGRTVFYVVRAEML
jgi:hypothetical protein